MSKLLDDGGPEVVVLDSDDEAGQALWVRVGPVYFGNDIADEPAVWLETS